MSSSSENSRNMKNNDFDDIKCYYGLICYPITSWKQAGR
ncbi:hypothetical protein Leryth_008308 [Lithospermum erythrorhizon]|nr:hypothetical protein Leryth_008308 [Lithospermum erythrorhizon]